MKNKTCTIAHFLSLLLLIYSWGCSTPPFIESDYMSFDSVEYIPGFTRSVTLTDKMSTAIDVIGARNFAIIADKKWC